MKSTVKSQIATGLLTLGSIAALTVRADPNTYDGRRVKGVDTQNGGAVETRNGAAAAKTKNGGAVETRNGAGAAKTQNGGAVQTRSGGTTVNGPNGTAVKTRNGNVYTQPSDNGRSKNGNVVNGPNGTAVRTPNGVYTKPK